MKTVLILAPHFLPSYVASVHRARLWCYHLEDYGWHPIILTTHSKYYECGLDWDLMDLLPNGLEIIQTDAIPTRPIRVIGDIGLRSLPWYFKAVKSMADARTIDFLHITIPQFSAALLGPRVRRRLGLRYGIDYIDPWVPESKQQVPFLGKRWVANQMARILEPIAVKRCSLITGISTAYFASVFKRNPGLSERCLSAAMPYGGTALDFEVLTRKPRPLILFDPKDGKRHFIYAGALLPKGVGVVEGFIAALNLILAELPELRQKIVCHFVGTSLPIRNGVEERKIAQMTSGTRAAELVVEHEGRISYLDVLNHLSCSAGIFVFGSTEKHYSPSKVYQAVLARRPVLAILHEACEVGRSLEASHAGDLVRFAEGTLPRAVDIAPTLRNFLLNDSFDPGRVDRSFFEETDARMITKRFAAALDDVVSSEQ